MSKQHRCGRCGFEQHQAEFESQHRCPGCAPTLYRYVIDGKAVPIHANNAEDALETMLRHDAEDAQLQVWSYAAGCYVVVTTPVWLNGEGEV